jgi:hypothetical protein
MKFNEAVEEMKVLAGMRAWAFEYEVASYLPNTEIHGYIAGIGHGEPHNTYQGAIDNMKSKINLKSLLADDPPEEIPELRPVTKRCILPVDDIMEVRNA